MPRPDRKPVNTSSQPGAGGSLGLQAARADVRVVLTINGALVLVLGILPGGLMTLCAQAIVKMLGS